MSLDAFNLHAGCRVALLALVLTSAAVPSALAQATLQQDSNRRYLNYNGQALALVGQSGEYLPHIARPPKDTKFCTLARHLECFQTLHNEGLNKIQVWVSLNMSIGTSDHTPPPQPPLPGPTPYAGEQPFLWTGSVWRLRVYDDAGFFTNLNNVLTDAANQGIIVEVTLFDPWSADQNTGDNRYSPWASANNTRNRQFFKPEYMVSFDSGTTDTMGDDPDMRQSQLLLVQHVVTQLNSHPNMYYNIANEPDLHPNIDPAALMNWHETIAQTIVSTEASLPVGHRTHLIGVNLATPQALDIIQNDTQHTYDNIALVNGHYVSFDANICSSKSKIGAIELNQCLSLGNRVLGFSETKASWFPNLAGARAEAEEFLFGEGGAYDNYTLGFFDVQPDQADTVRKYLRYASGLVSKMSLTSINSTQTGSSPSWVTGVGAYGQPDGSGLSSNTYWSTMLWARNQFGLYIHHSKLPSSRARYCPVCNSPTGFHENLTLNWLGSVAWEYKVEWYVYDETNPGNQTAAVCSTNVAWSGIRGQTIPITGPTYPWDRTLIVTRCPANSPCVAEVPCPTGSIAANHCPPADPVSCN